MRIWQVLRQAGTEVRRAIAADLRGLNRRFNPWVRQAQMRNELDQLHGKMKACEILQETYARHIEVVERGRLAGDAVDVYLQDELEKIRLRLSAPAQEPAPQRPETWADRKLKLELEYATKKVNGKETTDAAKSNAA